MRKRDMSTFVARELLYDYKKSILDDERAKIVEQHLSQSKELIEELSCLTRGMEYMETLKALAMSDDVIQLVKAKPQGFRIVLQKISWYQIPQSVRWAIEALLVAFAIALFVTQLLKLWSDGAVNLDNTKTKTIEIPIKNHSIELQAPIEKPADTGSAAGESREQNQ